MAVAAAADVDDTVPAKIGCSGWNAEPNEGRNLKPIDGLNMADDGDKCSVSLDFKQTLNNWETIQKKKTIVKLEKKNIEFLAIVKINVNNLE